jgi:acetoin utilization deacetylase AcuC-like enzyme
MSTNSAQSEHSSGLVVVVPVDVASFSAETLPVLQNQVDIFNDGLDNFSHPRLRRLYILHELWKRQHNGHPVRFDVLVPQNPDDDVYKEALDLVKVVHSSGLVEFFQHAWELWDQMGKEGRQDPLSSMASSPTLASPPLIPLNTSLHRDHLGFQRPSQNVMGQIGYYCTDLCTPIFANCLAEICLDILLVSHAVEKAIGEDSFRHLPPLVYAIPTHPGHHAARDCFGGYCYVNNAALAVKQFQSRLSVTSDTATSQPVKVAVLDVDYHVGNGTTSIFYTDPTVLVISIHCDPNFDYPFHSGFADEAGADEGMGTTLNLPLPPGTEWEPTYRLALEQALQYLVDFRPDAVVISLGLDTHLDDPVALRRAGFRLQGDDYTSMGQTMARFLKPLRIPVLALQEGGYRMETVGVAAANVVFGYCQADS